ncbi:hypothetical protein ACH4FX_08205 [Streptomyces sp. NPDC018019]|uniref:hypothetical protein n=1 Tax=Streptomyces sp. NPDC018019 TaxID=3365030 RepID=UPI00378DF593
MFWDSKAEPKTLKTVAAQGDELRSGTLRGVIELDAAHQKISSETEGFAFAQELLKIERSWRERLGVVADECGSLSQLPRETAGRYEKNEEHTTEAFSGGDGKSSILHDNPFG